MRLPAGLATNCEITRYNKFDRKNYFYPDLPKAYQISQLYLPICRNGHVDIVTAAGEKSVGIHEIHMEEDAGKLMHDPWLDQTMVDYNRCGVPLLEIVSEPDMRSAEEVIAYLTKLRQTLQYLGVSDCKMQEGSMRADVNLSVRPVGQKEFGTRTEMKNINSFKAIARAIAGEYRRQVELIEDGGKVQQQTRRWDDNKGASFAMRSKENAQDYRYFPEPDLPPISLSQALIDAVRARQPELAEAKAARYQSEFGLPKYDAGILTEEKPIADLFEQAGFGMRKAEGGFQLDHGRNDGDDEGKERACRKSDVKRTGSGCNRFPLFPQTDSTARAQERCLPMPLTAGRTSKAISRRMDWKLSAMIPLMSRFFPTCLPDAKRTLRNTARATRRYSVSSSVRR